MEIFCCSLLNLLLNFCSVTDFDDDSEMEEEEVVVMVPRGAIVAATTLDLLLSAEVLVLLFLLDSGIFEVELEEWLLWWSLL